jgi:hypothetical protein
MKTKRKNKNPFPLSEAAVFYDAAVDHPRESFALIVTRVVPKGFNQASPTFKKEARKMFDLARR